MEERSKRSKEPEYARMAAYTQVAGKCGADLDATAVRRPRFRPRFTRLGVGFMRSAFALQPARDDKAPEVLHFSKRNVES